MNEKPTNPKDACGVKKIPASVVPQSVMAEVALGMFEGARKYGRHNYRVIGVRASIYYDATRRHIDAWWEGEDDDPDTGLNHITKAITSLVVLRDAMIQDKLTDDRPPEANPEHKDYLDQRLAELFERLPQSVEAYTRQEKKPLNEDPWEGVLDEGEDEPEGTVPRSVYEAEGFTFPDPEPFDPWTEFDDRCPGCTEGLPESVEPNPEPSFDFQDEDISFPDHIDWRHVTIQCNTPTFHGPVFPESSHTRCTEGLAQSQEEFFKR